MVGYNQLPVSALPQVDYPTIVVTTLLPGRQRRHHGLGGDHAARAPARADPSLAQLTSVISAAARRSRCSSRSIATSTPPSRTCRRRSTRRRTCCRARCRRRRPTARATRPTCRSSSLGGQLGHLAASSASTTTPTRSWRRRSRRSRGVGLVTLNGGQRPAVRVQVDPVALAGRGLRLEDVRAVLVAANVNQPKGNLDGPRQNYTSPPTISSQQAERLQAAGPRLPERRAGAPLRRGQGARRRGERAARRLGQRATAPSSSTCSASRAPT